MSAKKTKTVTSEQFQEACREIEEAHPGHKATYRELQEKLSCSNSTIARLMKNTKASCSLINSYPVEQAEQACKEFTNNLTGMLARVCQTVEEKANARILEMEKIGHEAISRCNQQITEDRQVISKQKLDIKTLSRQASDLQSISHKLESLESQIAQLVDFKELIEHHMTGIQELLKKLSAVSECSKNSDQAD